MGNENESGERAVIDADRVRNRERGRGCGRICRRGVTEAAWSTVLEAGKPSGVVGVAGALISQDPDDAQDRVGLGTPWHRSRSASAADSAGVKGPGVDARESTESDGGYCGRERGQV